MNAYIFHITPYDLAFTGIIFTGLTFVLLLWFSKRVNQTANRMLGLGLVVVVLWIAWVLGDDIGLATYFSWWNWVPLQFSLALGPLLYFYVLKVIQPVYKFGQEDLPHFIPVLLQQGALFLQINLHIPAFFLVGVYLYLSFRLIERFYKRQKFNDVSDRYYYHLQWLHRLLAAFSLLWLLWIPITAIDYFYYHNGLAVEAYYTLYILLAGMMIWMAASGFSKSETVAPATPALTSSLPAALKQKGAWLKKAMETNLYHQDPDLSLSSLAELLKVHPHELSRIINVALRKNFNDFVNEYRIREITLKMQDPANDRLTLVGIAFDCGFKSKTTFNRVFREMTGKSAAEYKSLIKNERPTYHLGLNPRPAAIISYHDATPVWPSNKLNRRYMFKNHLKIAWRNLLRHKRFSLINITGLAVGLAVCMTIMLYVAHEHSYDRFQANADRLVMVRVQQDMNGMMRKNDLMSFATGAIIKQRVPAVEEYSNYLAYFNFLPLVVNQPSAPKDKFNETGLFFAAPNFFSFFSFKLINGSPADALTKPYSVVITRDMAKKYFGNENPIGKTLTIKTDTAFNYQVTGVAENIPSNSSISFNFVASVSTLNTYKSSFPYFNGGQQISEGFFTTWFRLKNISDTARVAKTLQGLIKEDGPSKSPVIVTLPLLTDQHLGAYSGNQANTKYLAIFPLVAVLILLLALVNYMSLATARSASRAKEVGVRKISGAGRKTLAMQFYIESTLITFIAFVLGYLLCRAIKPWFLNILQLKIDSSFLYSPTVLLSLSVLFIVTILIAGSYPALMLSAFKPVVAMKGIISKQTGGITVRKIFTVFQFAIATALIICGIVIDRQLYFFRHTDTGIDRENVLMVPISADLIHKYQSFKTELKGLTGIADIGTANSKMFLMMGLFSIKGKTPNDTKQMASQMVDKELLRMLGMKWKIPPAKGAELSDPDMTKVLINEAAINDLNLPKDPVGNYLETDDAKTRLQVVGILKNYNFGPLKFAIQPLALRTVPETYTWNNGCCMYVKVKPHNNLPTLINNIKTIYQKYDAETPFSYTFMDDAFNLQFKAEDRLASIFSIFTIVTIVLAAMGLFGLAAFSIEQRTKEIGIRKVLGASIPSINGLLSKDFLKLVLLSIIISSPAAWWAMHSWLQNFANRISIQWWMFGFAGLLSIIVAVITVSYHAVKAAVANPVKSLRSE